MPKRIGWLVVALALFALGGWLMTTKPARFDKPRHDRDEFPRKMRPKESARLDKRRVVLPEVPESGKPPRQRDRFLAALPPRGGRTGTALVFEADAMKSMPVGQMFLRCMRQRGRDVEMEQRLGVQPDSIERVGYSDEVTLLEGDLSSAKVAAAFEGTEPEQYGSATIFHSDDEDARRPVIASVGDRFVLLGKDDADIKAAIDRMDGRAEEETPAVGDSDAYGEIYGVLGVEAFAGILDREQPELADRVRAAANRIELHVDASDDVLLVSDVTGPSGKDVGDLGQALGGALAMARVGAQSGDDENLAQLLEGSRIRPRQDAFGVEVALPLDLIERSLGPCAKDGGAPEE